MESQPQNPEFRNDPKNFHPCICLPACQDVKNIANPDTTVSEEAEAVWAQSAQFLQESKQWMPCQLVDQIQHYTLANTVNVIKFWNLLQ